MQRYARVMRAEPTRWLRGPKARHHAGWIELDRGGTETFSPITEAGAAFDLAAVRTPDDAVAFVRRHGLLTQGPESVDLREPFTLWQEHAGRVQTVLLAYRGLTLAAQGDPDGVKLLGAIEAVWRGNFQAPPANDEELTMQATKAVAWLVSDGLEGTEERIDPASPNDPEWGFAFNAHPPNLLGYLYHELAMALTTRVPLGSCVECQRFYPITDRRQRFCSKTCADRARHRTYRQRKREKETAQ